MPQCRQTRAPALLRPICSGGVSSLNGSLHYCIGFKQQVFAGIPISRTRNRPLPADYRIVGGEPGINFA